MKPGDYLINPNLHIVAFIHPSPDNYEKTVPLVAGSRRYHFDVSILEKLVEREGWRIVDPHEYDMELRRREKTIVCNEPSKQNPEREGEGPNEIDP